MRKGLHAKNCNILTPVANIFTQNNIAFAREQRIFAQIRRKTSKKAHFLASGSNLEKYVSSLSVSIYRDDRTCPDRGARS